MLGNGQTGGARHATVATRSDRRCRLGHPTFLYRPFGRAVALSREFDADGLDATVVLEGIEAGGGAKLGRHLGVVAL